MIMTRIIYAIGMCPLSPLWLKMWCLRRIFRNIQQSIDRLPADKRQHFERVDREHGTMKA